MATKAKEIAVQEDQHSVPAYLREVGQLKMGNVDRSDMVIPRIKLLQAISPELEVFDNAKAGNFWHTIAEEQIGGADGGADLQFVPILVRKSYTLWAPRGDDRGVLARAVDGINWDTKEKFLVKPKGASGQVEWDTTAGTVTESGLDQFGTSIPGDKQSAPAASLTYEVLAYFPDHPELSPAVILNTRSAVKPAKQLISKIMMKDVPHFGQVFIASPIKAMGAEGPYFTYAYTANGYVQDQNLFNSLAKMYDSFSKGAWRSSDMSTEDQGSGTAAPQASSRF